MSLWKDAGKVISAVAVGAATVAANYEAIQNTIDSSQHMMRTGRELVEREARLNGGSYAEALARLSHQADRAVTGYDALHREQIPWMGVGIILVGFVLLLFLLRR